MFKFTKIKYGLLALSMILPNISFAQNVCNLKVGEMHSLIYEIFYDNMAPAETNLKNNCYPEFNKILNQAGQNASFLLIDSLEDLRLLEKINPNIYNIKNYQQQDILSMFLTKKLVFTDLDSVGNKMKKELSIKDDKVRKKVIDRQKEEELLVHLAKYYVQSRIKSKDVNNRDAFSYAVYMLEPKVLEVLKESYRLEIVMKGKDVMSPFHIAFVKKPKIANQENLEKVNDVLVQLFEIKYLPLLKVQTLSFVDYMELMKGNNPDLYDKLMKKISSSGNKLLLSRQSSLNNLAKEEKERLFNFYEDHANYEKRLRE